VLIAVSLSDEGSVAIDVEKNYPPYFLLSSTYLVRCERQPPQVVSAGRAIALSFLSAHRVHCTLLRQP